MNKDKELVEAIERLGDYIHNCVELVMDIKNMIKDREGIHSYNVDIVNISRDLLDAEIYYTEFYRHYLGKLARKH